MRLRLSFTCTVVVLLTVILTGVTPLSAQTISYIVVPITSPFDPPGIVVGYHINKAGVIPLVDRANGRPAQGFLWKGTKPVPFFPLGGDCSSAADINDHGRVVGNSCLPGESEPHAFLYFNAQKVVDLGTFGGTSAGAQAVNLSNQVVGNYSPDDGTGHAFFWEKKHWVDLGNLGGSFTYPYGINNAATVTGQSDVSNTPDPVFGIPPFHGYQWSGGVLTDFGQIFGSNFNYGFGINDSGMIAGSADIAGDAGAHAIIWQNGVVQDLTPYGPISAGGLGINSQGDVIGSWGYVDPDPNDGPPVDVMECPCYAVLWHNGQAIFLNDVVPAGWNLYLGLAVSDRGEILARGTPPDGGPYETVLLRPRKWVKNAQYPPSSILTKERAMTYPASAPRKLRRQQNGGWQELH
jgi:probable HAF family extracellular repeat protein